ncbi:MAG: type II toxin-antitoxin system VapB family antitoxin [Acidimicrobiales bacterium]
MTRTRVSTTVDGDLLTEARALRQGASDASLFDEALGALLLRNRRTVIDEAYAAYDEAPLSEVDEWGSLAVFREAAGAS